MNIFAFLVVFIGYIDGTRYKPRGNHLRSMTVDFSSLSPQQAEIIRRLIKQNCIKKYGRFGTQYS